MSTHIRNRMEVVVHDNVILALITQQLPEGASQTFPAGSPLKYDSGSGTLLEFVAITDSDLAAFATQAAHNDAAGGEVSGVILVPGLFQLEGNFLGAAAAANVLAQTDFMKAFELAKSSTLVHGTDPGWYIADVTTNPALRISAFLTSYPLPNVIDGDKTKAGDTDARVRAVPLISKLEWDA